MTNSSTSFDLDVAVIGAGLAGLTTARELAARGLRVALIDRKTDLRDGVHTTGIFVRRTFVDFSLPEECLGPAVSRVRLYSPRGRSFELSSPRDEFRVGRMPLLYERLLHDCEQAGVQVELGARLLSVSMSEATGHPAGSVVRVSRDHAVRELSCRYIVGADGATSRVAAALGLSENREWIVGVEEVLRSVPLDGPPIFHCLLHPRWAPGYLAWIVHDGEEVHLGVGGYAHRFEPWPALEEFRRWSAQVIDLTQAEVVERRGGRIPVGGVLPRIVNQHGLLVGDAAGAVSPLTAGGLDPCLRMSTLAAEVIDRHLSTGDERILDYYDGRQFRAKFQRRLWMRAFLKRVRSPLLLELSCAALSRWPGRLLARKVFFGHGSFPDLALPPRAPTPALSDRT